MRAVVYRGPGDVAVADVPQPTLVDPADAIVRVRLTAICGTDLHVVRGDFPGVEPGAVIGHEFVGEVVEAGPALQRIGVGDRVMSSDFSACGYCRWCDRGDHWHCGERAFFGTGRAFGPPLAGAQAEFVRVPHADRTLGTIPAGVSPEAALLMGDNLATGWAAIERAAPEPGDCIAVIGGGAIGQLTALCAQAAAAGPVVVIEPNAKRRAFAAERGCLVAHPDEADAVVRGATGGDGADVVVEAVGGNGPLDLALRLARPRARIVSVGAHAAPTFELPVSRAFRDELTLSFAIGDGIRLRRRLAGLVAGGALDPTVIIDARGTLADAPRFYADLVAQRHLKVVLTP